MSDEKTRPRRTTVVRPTNPTPAQPTNPDQAPSASAVHSPSTVHHPPSPSTPAPPPSIADATPTPQAAPDQPTQPTPSPAPTQSTTPSRLFSGIPNWLAFWLPIATSLLALVVAVTGFIAATQDPDVNMVLPKLIRMVQNPNAEIPEPTILYVQPKFVSTGRNDKLDVILDITIRVEPLSGGEGADFVWNEQGIWQYRPETRDLQYYFLADAGPLMVSPSNPQLPVGLFFGPPGWTFQPGDYLLTITAARAVGSTPLQGTIVVSFSETMLDMINSSEGARFGVFNAKP